MEKEKITATFDKHLIDSIYFNYLNDDDRKDIKTRIEQNLSVVVGFYVSHETIFCTVLDFEYAENKLHVREVAGLMSKIGVINGYKLLNHFCNGFAKALRLKYVSFHGERSFHKKVYSSFGFQNIGNDDFLRKVH